jgi:hypothetical protein
MLAAVADSPVSSCLRERVGLSLIHRSFRNHPSRAHSKLQQLGRVDATDPETVVLANGRGIPGPDVGDYAGLPITPAARKRANTWEASLLTLPEHQCKPHPSTYGFRGIGQLRLSLRRKSDSNTRRD